MNKVNNLWCPDDVYDIIMEVFDDTTITQTRNVIETIILFSGLSAEQKKPYMKLKAYVPSMAYLFAQKNCNKLSVVEDLLLIDVLKDMNQ